MKTLRDKITARIEECERTGNILDISGLHTALALLDETMKHVSDDQSAKADALCERYGAGSFVVRMVSMAVWEIDRIYQRRSEA